MTPSATSSWRGLPKKPLSASVEARLRPASVVVGVVGATLASSVCFDAQIEVAQMVASTLAILISISARVLVGLDLVGALQGRVLLFLLALSVLADLHVHGIVAGLGLLMPAVSIAVSSRNDYLVVAGGALLCLAEAVLAGNTIPTVEITIALVGVASGFVVRTAVADDLQGDGCQNTVLPGTHFNGAFNSPEDRYRYVVESCADGQVAYELGLVTQVNKAFEELVQSTAKDVVTRGIPRYFPQSVRNIISAEITEPSGQEIDTELSKEDGTLVPVTVVGSRIRHGSCSITLLTIRDRRRQEAVTQSLRALGHRDHLTGLLNRRGLFERVGNRLTPSVESGHNRLGVVYIDLDDFKTTNDHYGHSAGDVVLQVTARRIESVIRSFDVAARLGGDEFVVVMDRTRTEEDVAKASLRIRDALGDRITYNDLDIDCSASVGFHVALKWDSLEELLDQADRAMYRSKQNQRSLGLIGAARTSTHESASAEVVSKRPS